MRFPKELTLLLLLQPAYGQNQSPESVAAAETRSQVLLPLDGTSTTFNCGGLLQLSPDAEARLLSQIYVVPLAQTEQTEYLDPLTVTATLAPEARSRVPFTVDIVPMEAFSNGIAVNPDDALLGDPDFSLFRRNDSMTANPTSQGVSLRGLGPSGASRSLVLLDGVPLNDPFGGWVPWSEVPVDWISSAELVPGGGASAWGNDALAGVIQLFSTEPAAGTGTLAARWGGFDTRSADITEAVGLGSGVLELRGEDFVSAGSVLIAPNDRGSIDIAAASRHDVESARWRGTLGSGVSLVATFRSFEEWRNNGTPYQGNQSHQLFGSLVVSGKAEPDESWNATAYLRSEGYSQTFSSVNAARTSETPASDQFAVPTTAAGLSASSIWTEAGGATTAAGMDARTIQGETREDFIYAGTRFTEQRRAGGAQGFAGLFAEQTQPLGDGVSAMAGVRVDRWQNENGHMTIANIESGALIDDEHFPGSQGTELSPSAGVTWKPGQGWVIHAAFQRGFREPTLNELYRPFRVGTTVTEANPSLSAEHADSAELGAIWTRQALRFAVEGFAVRLEDAVDNVTLVQGPGTFPIFGPLPVGGVGQERLNLDRVDTAGAQAELSFKPSDLWSLELSVVDQTATVAAASVAPKLVGHTLPEVPRWSTALGITIRPVQRVFFTARVRSTSSEFDDDLNQLPLASATVIDASLRITLPRHTEVFASVDNLADATVETAHSGAGVISVAPGRMASLGARIDW